MKEDNEQSLYWIYSFHTTDEVYQMFRCVSRMEEMLPRLFEPLKNGERPLIDLDLHAYTGTHGLSVNIQMNPGDPYDSIFVCVGNQWSGDPHKQYMTEVWLPIQLYKEYTRKYMKTIY